MKNLAGCKESDIWCAAELTAAGIEIEVVEKPYGEPQTRVAGRLGRIEFRRAWYYWVARGRVPLDVARRLYDDPVGRRDVRVAGHCGCPPPEEWASWFDGDEHVVLDPDGAEEAKVDEFIAKGVIPADSKPRYVRTTDGLRAYVMSYHIDSAKGLRLFSERIQIMQLREADRVTPEGAEAVMRHFNGVMREAIGGPR